jgi:aryl-alcohol dehydrogenase-like predicted oxidoreductase
MKYRALGRTDLTASEISFGSWAIGGEWGTVDDEVSHATLNAAVDSGVTFIDAADAYGMGRSEGLLAWQRIDFLQFHCPPTEVCHRPEVLQSPDDPRAAGEIRCYGASLVPSSLVKGASS